jgi:hypothetical protein
MSDMPMLTLAMQSDADWQLSTVCQRLSAVHTRSSFVSGPEHWSSPGVQSPQYIGLH